MKSIRLLPLGIALVILHFGGSALADDSNTAAAKSANDSAPSPATTERKVNDPAPSVTRDKAASTPPPPLIAGKESKAPGEQKRDEDDSSKEAREELAHAQQMADAALAAQDDSSPVTQDSTPTTGPNPDASDCEDEFSQSPVATTIHHRIDNLTNPDLGPDYADPKHHTMGELF